MKTIIFTNPKFNIGQLLATASITHELKNLAFHQFCMNALNRHTSGDWGDLCDDDKNLNNLAVTNGNRIFSAYNIPANLIQDDMPNDKIYIITEARYQGVRKSTTILFPADY